MTAPDRVWIDAEYIDSARTTAVLACNLGTADHGRALQSDTEYVRADLYAALVEINESQAAEIARLMKPR